MGLGSLKDEATPLIRSSKPESCPEMTRLGSFQGACWERGACGPWSALAERVQVKHPSAHGLK